jgi:hypothetical protein
MHGVRPENEYERKLLDNVDRFGWQCTSVAPQKGEANTLRFSYTVGLYHSFGQPEFIMFGLDASTAHSILSILANAAAAQKMYPLDEPCDALIDNYSCVFVEVPKAKYSEYVASAIWLNGGEDFPLYQVVWPDEEGRFPWHRDAARAFDIAQPVLGAPRTRQ